MKETKRKYKHSSPVGWYVASYLLRFTELDDVESPMKRYTAWENTILVRADDPDEAHEKAVMFAELNCEPYVNIEGKRVRFVFEGLTSLVAVYEELEDGAEIIWTEHENRALRSLRKLVKRKEDLEVFEE